jgi:aldose 1-epimerase
VSFPIPTILSEREWSLYHGRQWAVVSARGGALRSYQVGGRHVVDGWADRELPPAFNGAVLAPWPNRIRDGRWSDGEREHVLPINEASHATALHGLVMWTDWQLTRHTPYGLTLACRLPAQPGYPFDLRLEVGWTLTEDGLRCDLGAQNLADEPAPFGIGTHPFFGFPDRRVDELELTVPAALWLATDDRLLPLELRPTGGTELDFSTPRSLAGVRLDTAFTGLDTSAAGTSQVSLSSDGVAIEVWADAVFGWWQVYTSDMFDPSDDRHRRSVAIEAMTCGPDAFNTGAGLIQLPPGGRWRGSWGVRSG